MSRTGWISPAERERDERRYEAEGEDDRGREECYVCHGSGGGPDAPLVCRVCRGRGWLPARAGL